MKKIVNALLLAALLPLQACGMYYSAEPITAHVVDAETGKPLEGVIVVAHWQLEGGLEGGNRLGQMMVMETVTDAQGRFHFAAWGPKTVPLGLLANPITANARLKDMDPQLLLFKRDYSPLVLRNERTMAQMAYSIPATRKSDWNSKTIRLEPFKEGLEKWAKRLEFFKTDLDFSYKSDSCEWKQTPRMLASMHREKMRLKSQAVDSSIRAISDVYVETGRCSSPEEFFGEYLQ